MAGPEKLLYDLFLALYRLGAVITSAWDTKAAQWRAGQKQVKHDLKNLSFTNKTIWVHCASLGEYEQARPLIDALKNDYPSYPIVLTFFSPSGYEYVKQREKEATVLYLPFDSPGSAKLFLKAVQPSLAIFIKYEHWHYYLKALQERDIPAISVSAVFRPTQIFFKWYGGFFRAMLQRYKYILVQDKDSLDLLESMGISNCTVSGDTRFDRVTTISNDVKEIPAIADFKGAARLVVAGSTWPQDEELLVRFINEQSAFQPGVKWLIVPHEINSQHIQSLREKLKVPAVTYSLASEIPDGLVMIVDTVGILSRSYRYAYVAYIGGGFGAGIHNTLEAAVYGVPLIFGPNYTKFREAKEMKAVDAAFAVGDYNSMEKTLKTLLADDAMTQMSGEKACRYVSEHTGSTEKVMLKIKGLLSGK